MKVLCITLLVFAVAICTDGVINRDPIMIIFAAIIVMSVWPLVRTTGTDR